jgi:hypothetical protein
MTLIFGYWRLTSDPDRIMVLHLHVWPQNEQGVLHILGNTRVGTWSLINSKLCTSFYSNTKLHWMDDLWMGDPDRNRLQPWQIDAEPAATGRGRPHLGDSGRSRDKGYCLRRYWPRLWQFFPLAGRDPNILVTPDHIDGRPRPAAGCGYRPPMSCTDTQAICTFELKFCTLLIWQRAAQLIQCWESPFVGFPFVIKNQPQKRRAKRAVATNFCGRFCDGRNGPKYWDIRKMRLYYSIVSKYCGCLRSFYTCTHVCISN